VNAFALYSPVVEFALRAAFWVALGYSGCLALVAFAQSWILFSTAKGVRPPSGLLPTHTVEPTRIEVDAATAVSGWMLLPREGRGPFPAILYFGGRSEEVSWLQDAAKWFPGHVVFTMNYRGYGESGGSPSERALFADALREFDHLARSTAVDPKRITVIGRSLGTGVAAYTAAKRPAENAVLITPYDSIVNLARSVFHLIPVGLILAHRFESIRFARSARQPCLALLAEHDDVVPEVHTRRLMEAWGGSFDVLRIPGSDHHDIPYRADTLEVIAGWIAKRPRWAMLPAVPAIPFARDR
jgi:dipeptidyl aminopeptidase/acylaminoacyl peptidase